MFKNWAHGWLLLHFTNTGWHDEYTVLQNYVKLTSCCNLIHSANLLEFSVFILLIWYLKKLESNVLHLLISMIWKSSFVSGPTCKVDVLSYIPIIYCSHFTFVSFPLAHTYYPIWPTNAKWLVIFIKKYHTMTLQSWHGSYVEINNHKFPKCTCLIFLYNG